MCFGEEVEKATCVKKVMEAMTAMLAALSFPDQFMGLLGSSGPSQPTMFGSTSVGLVVMSDSFLYESSLRRPASRSDSFSKLEPEVDAFPFATGMAEIGTFSVPRLQTPSWSEIALDSGLDGSTLLGSVDGMAFDAECGAVAGIASGLVASGAPLGRVTGLIDGPASGTDKATSAGKLDAIPGAVHVSCFSGPVVRAFRMDVSFSPSSAAGGTVPEVVV